MMRGHRGCFDEARPFQCFQWLRLPPLAAHAASALHSERLTPAVECLEDILKHPPCAFSLGEGAFCACRASDGQYYLLCQDRVVLRLSGDAARGSSGKR
jgi:hypothetical protein